MTRKIHRFGAWAAQKSAPTAALIGGKGASLAEMSSLGLPVPPGFTITTEVCNAWREADEAGRAALLDDLMVQVDDEVHRLWLALGYHPLVSVRSGAPVSMPGMMDTVLNVGLCDENLPEWQDRIGQRAALDSYRRLIQMLGTTAYGVPESFFELALADFKKQYGVTTDAGLPVEGLQALIKRFRWGFRQHVGRAFPRTATEQMRAAIVAVFRSWMNPRAVEYRRLFAIPESMGTAVTVQAMVFGNTGEDSGSGVLFTRDPSTGEPRIVAEYLSNAQGEDVVAGIRTPEKLDLDPVRLTGAVPAWRSELAELCGRLEAHYRDMMDVEFTVQHGALYVLQCRVGKRAARAAFRIAHDFVQEGRITVEEALSRLTRSQYKMLRRPRVDHDFAQKPCFTGLPASPGVAVGRPVFSAQEAAACAEPCVLVTRETNPGDLAGMARAQGVLTQTGGITSHAAVVCRAMDRPCVVGVGDLPTEPSAWAGVTRVTICGITGRVWRDVEVPVVDASAEVAMQAVTTWVLGVTSRSVQVDMPLTAPAQQHVMAAEWWGDSARLDLVLQRLAALATREGVVLDLTPPEKFTFPGDALLAECAGPLPAPAWLEGELGAALIQHAGALQGLCLVLPTSQQHSAVSESLHAAGYRIATEPRTLAEFLISDVVQLRPEFVASLGGEIGWQRLQDLLAAAGRTKSVLQPSCPAEYAVFTVLRP